MKDDTKINTRLQSLDALRGFDMFFIMGGDALFLCLGTLLPGSLFEMCGAQMLHVAWDGFAFEDLIFPLFLFLAGVSFPFSLSKQCSLGCSDSRIILRIVRRGIMLIFLGMIYNGFLQFDFENLRYASVLGRIGAAWMFAALLYMWLGWRRCILLSVVILLGYWALLAFVTAPDANGASGLSMEGSVVGYVDRMLLPGRLHNTIHDPEGLLSTLPAIVTAMLGIFSGKFIMSGKRFSGYERAGALVCVSLLLIALGLLWNFLLPVNKNLWSSSFVCLAGGISMGLFALFYFIVDVLQWRRWAFFFKVVGMNSITIYLAQQFFDFGKPAKAFFGGLISLFPDSWYSVLYWLAYIAVCWMFLYFLYKHKIFLKV